MDPEERHDDPPQCYYDVKITIVKEVSVKGPIDANINDLADSVIDQVKEWLEEDDIVAAEITDAVRMD